jgi:hypothetical protein
MDWIFGGGQGKEIGRHHSIFRVFPPEKEPGDIFLEFIVNKINAANIGKQENGNTT